MQAHRASTRWLQSCTLPEQGDTAEFARLPEGVVGQGEEIEAAYRSVGGPFTNAALDEALAEILGEGHGGHGGY